jgi:alpha-tubulin suppressor-like RCC1 family protein
MQRKCSSILRQKSWVKDWATELWGKKRRGMATRRESRQRWVALWGNGDYGRLGLASSKSVWEPTLCTSLQHTQPVAVACGGAHTLVLTEEGRVYATGLNDWGQAGMPLSTRHSLVSLDCHPKRYPPNAATVLFCLFFFVEVVPFRKIRN